ncbi:MAG: hypothetical protein AAFN81_25450 [Bacteroidota bacterium]
MDAAKTSKARILKVMYAINVACAGIPGFLIVFFPATAEAHLLWPEQDYAVMMILGSIWLAIGISSFLGIYRPFQFIGIFAVQLIYKVIWLAIFFLPYLLSGEPILLAMKIIAVVFVLLVTEFALFLRPRDFSAP